MWVDHIQIFNPYCSSEVNDLGGGIHGEGQASRPADEVVSIIKSRGGVAVPNYGMFV